MLTAFPLDSDRLGHVLPCDVAVTGECNVWHLYNWVFDAYRTIQPGSLQVSLNGSAWQMVPRLSTLNDGGWVNQALQANLPVGSVQSGANTVRFRVTSPASDDSRVSNVKIEQTRTVTYTPPLPPEPISRWAASIPGAHK